MLETGLIAKVHQESSITYEQAWYHGAPRNKISLPCPLQLVVPKSYGSSNRHEDFGIKFKCVPINCDNTSAICISHALVHHSRVKHIHIRHHFLKDNVEKGLVKVEFFPTENQIADI